MMKIRSVKLYRYLEAQGVLGSDLVVIKQAKKEYRRLYLKKYRTRRKKEYKRVSITLSLGEIQQLKHLAQNEKIKLPTLCKNMVRSYLKQKPLIQDRKTMLEIYKLIGLAINQSISSGHRPSEYLQRAEQLLEQYVNR